MFVSTSFPGSLDLPEYIPSAFAIIADEKFSAAFRTICGLQTHQYTVTFFRALLHYFFFWDLKLKVDNAEAGSVRPLIFSQHLTSNLTRLSCYLQYRNRLYLFFSPLFIDIISCRQFNEPIREERNQQKKHDKPDTY